MCCQCRAKGKDIEWDHWCFECLGAYPWDHQRASKWLVILRKVARLLTGRFSLRIDWEA
jgi:hypothetical protein